MAHHGIGTARARGGHAPPEPADLAMTDRVDADVHRVKPPGADQVLDSRSGEPDLQQLAVRNDSVLPSSELSDRSTTWALSMSNSARERVHVGHAAHHATRRVTAGLQALQLGHANVKK